MECWGVIFLCSGVGWATSGSVGLGGAAADGSPALGGFQGTGLPTGVSRGAGSREEVLCQFYSTTYTSTVLTLSQHLYIGPWGWAH